MKTKKTKTALRRRPVSTRVSKIYLVQHHDVTESYWGVYDSIEDAVTASAGQVEVYEATPHKIGAYKNIATLVGKAATAARRTKNGASKWQ